MPASQPLLKDSCEARLAPDWWALSLGCLIDTYLGSCPLLGFSTRLFCDTLGKGDRVSSKRVFSRKRESMMEEASLLSLPEGMRVEHIQITEEGLVIEVEASHPTSCCPLWTQP